MGLVVQLALRPEEDFALRGNDVLQDRLVIDEALVDGETKESKTPVSADRGQRFLKRDKL